MAMPWLLRRVHASMLRGVQIPGALKSSLEICRPLVRCNPAMRFLSSAHPEGHAHARWLNAPDNAGLHQALLTKLSELKQRFQFSAPKVPKGFENFVPKGKSGQESKTPGADKGAPGSSEKSDQDGKNKGDSGGDKGGKGGGPGGNPVPENWLFHVAFASAALAVLLMTMQGGQGREINMQEFLTVVLESGKVEHLQVINNKMVKVFLKGSTAGEIDQALSRAKGGNGGGQASSDSSTSAYYFTIGSVDSFERKLEQAQAALGISAKDMIPVYYSNEISWATEMVKFLPTLLIIGVWLYVMQQMSGSGGGSGMGGPGNIFRVYRAKPTIIKGDQKDKITFKDVAGLAEAKVEVVEFVDFLKNPDKFKNLGARIPKGALLCGPPGTGKTLLARAMAGEANVPFFSMSGSDFIEMFVGVGASRVRDLFSQARASAPCIVFIDEIDAVGRARNKGGFGGGNDERENTLNQLLVEMDGFNPITGIVVLAGTNRVDILDPALLRPGRFDRQISIDKPDIKGRFEIYMVHLKKIKLADDMTEVAKRMSSLTPGFAGADIANVCNEAALIAARRNKLLVDISDFEAAIERVIGGIEKKGKILSKEERRCVAFHEAGHAICGWFLEHADPLLKVSIIPRGTAALGYNQFLPRELSLYSREQLLDMMCMSLGGRVAEEIVFGRITTGASDDLDKVTKLAYAQITVYGMNDRVGTLSFQSSGQEFNKPFSEATAQIMDEEARKLVSGAYERTRVLLLERREQLNLVAETLLQQEMLVHDDMVRLVGPRPFVMSDTYKEFVDTHHKWKSQTPAADVKAEAKEGAAAEPAQPSAPGAGGPVAEKAATPPPV